MKKLDKEQIERGENNGSRLLCQCDDTTLTISTTSIRNAELQVNNYEHGDGAKL
jgi:hypothetical protein